MANYYPTEPDPPMAPGRDGAQAPVLRGVGGGGWSMFAPAGPGPSPAKSPGPRGSGKGGWGEGEPRPCLFKQFTPAASATRGI